MVYGQLFILGKKRLEEYAGEDSESELDSDEWISSHEDKLKSTVNRDEDVNIQRAYKLMNQDEMIRKNHEQFWSDLKQIKN